MVISIIFMGIENELYKKEKEIYNQALIYLVESKFLTAHSQLWGRSMNLLEEIVRNPEACLEEKTLRDYIEKLLIYE